MSTLAFATSQQAVAGMAGAVGIQLAAPLLSKIPGIGTPIGRMAVGAVIAYLGHAALDDHAKAVVIGIGMGLVAQGLVALALPQMVSA